MGLSTHIGIYPGTFDPITDGHLDVIKRASHVVDRLIVGVAGPTGKEDMLFSLEERTAMVAEECMRLKNGDNIEVMAINELLIDFVRRQEANMVIRGLRAVSDFEYEFQMAGMNRRMAPDVETLFLMASEKYHFISSRFVKEVARLGGDISHFCPPNVVRQLQAKLDSTYRQSP